MNEKEYKNTEKWFESTFEPASRPELGPQLVRVPQGVQQGELVLCTTGSGLPYAYITFLSQLAQKFDPTEEEYLQGLYERLKQTDEKARMQEEKNNEESFLNRKYSI